MKTYIKDFYKRIIGSVEEKPNGDKIYKDFYGRIVAKYEKTKNVTKDFYGRIVAHGDQTAMLINMQYAETHKKG